MIKMFAAPPMLFVCKKCLWYHLLSLDFTTVKRSINIAKM